MDRTFTPTFSLKHFNGENVHEIPIEKKPGEVFELEEQVEGVVRAIREGAPLAASGEDGRWSVAMCLAARQSVNTANVITL